MYLSQNLKRKKQRLALINATEDEQQEQEIASDVIRIETEVHNKKEPQIKRPLNAVNRLKNKILKV